MKTRIRQIARAGVFGSAENPQTVTEQDLKEIYESFAEMNSSPIVLGHDFSGSNPRFGEVVGLELKDGFLYGITKEQDVLATFQSVQSVLPKPENSIFIISPIWEKSLLQLKICVLQLQNPLLQ